MSRGSLLESGESLPGVFSSQGAGTAGALDPTTLSVAIELADQAMRGLSMPRSAYATLLSDLYEGVAMRMPFRQLLDFARATAMNSVRGMDCRQAG
jgi:hypothetical protein